MKRWSILAAALLVLLLLAWLATPGGPRSGPEGKPEETPVPESVPAPEVPVPSETNEPGEVTEAPAEPEPVGDLGPGRQGQVPEELLAAGDATLHLWLVDSGTEAPVARFVTLWRLGVPEGDGWSGGDQIQKAMPVPVGGTIVADLPPGRYRLQCDEQRKGAPDPAAFTISSGKNVRYIKILLPRTFRARLRVFEPDGNEIREGILETARSTENRETSSHAPKWAKPRGPLEGRGYTLSGGHSDGFVTDWDPRPNPLAGDLGFDLGAHEESSRVGTQSKTHRLRVEGRCEVTAGVSSDLGRDVTLCGIAMPLARMIEGVQWPVDVKDGPAAAQISARCFARIHEGGDAFATAKRATYYVLIQLPGYRRLSYRWSPAAPVVPRTFRPGR